MKNTLFLLLALFLSISAHAEEQNPCIEGVEGAYGGTFGPNGYAMRLNLMCVDGKHLTGVFSDQDPDKKEIKPTMIINLPFIQVDGKNLVASVAPTKPDARWYVSSKSLFSYFKLDIAGLRKGDATGIFFNGNARSFQQVHIKRLQELPKLSASGQTHSADSLFGVYSLTAPFLGKGILLADVLEGAPIFSLQFTNAPSIHIVNSALWDNSGLISASSSAGDTEPDGNKIFYLRGRMLSDHELELYIVTPVSGLLGPFRATKN